MPLSDHEILITPNKGQSADPTMRFTGGNASVASSINVTMYADSTLSFEGTAGQLFSINNSLTGTIFSVNDVSGIPSIEVIDTGLIKLAQYNGNVGIGTSTVTGGTKLYISQGNVKISEGSNNVGIIFSDGTYQKTAFTVPVTVANGGTGAATLTANGVLYGNGTSAVQITAQGGANTILTANAGAPSFSASPTIGTSVTTPLVIGGTAASSTLTIESTSGTGTSDSIVFKTGSQATAMTIISSGYVGIGTTIPTSNLQVVGSFAATTKSFLIDHPTETGKKLQYGSLESPYHGVRLTGEGTLINGKCTVKLPNYIKGLCKQEGAQVQITNVRHGKVIWVESVDVNKNQFTVETKVAKTDKKAYAFYWSFTAVRKDIEDLEVEF